MIFFNGIKGCDALNNNSFFLYWNVNGLQLFSAPAENCNVLQENISLVNFKENLLQYNAKNFGTILTNQQTSVLSDESYPSNTGYNYITFRTLGTDLGSFKVAVAQGNRYLVFDGSLSITALLTLTSGLTVSDGETNLKDTNITGDLSVSKNITAAKKIEAATLNVTDAATIENSLTVKGPINATFLNATSDQRAKTNIKKSNFSALDIINQLSIYNFNYKENGKAAIGIIAQEAKDIQIDDFSIVNNKNATGENGDYMNIAESKLIYILWKAIQEQQEEIASLKAKLEG